MKPKSSAKATPKRTAKGRRSKGKLQNGLQKAKVTAVKTKRRLSVMKNKDETYNLLEKTANDSNLNGSFTGDNSPVDPTFRVSRMTKKMKSLVSLKNGDSTPTRRSKRNVPPATNGSMNGSDMDVSMAQEATEENVGSLKKTISKIWNKAGSYTNLQEAAKDTTKKDAKGSTKKDPKANTKKDPKASTYKADKNSEEGEQYAVNCQIS